MLPGRSPAQATIAKPGRVAATLPQPASAAGQTAHRSRGSHGATIQDTLVITNAASGIATVEEVTANDVDPNGRTSFTFTPVGTMAIAAITCPAPDSLSFGYTATATTFMPILGNSASLYIRQ